MPPFTLMKHRPSLPWNLIKTDSDRSNEKLEKSPRKGSTPLPKLVRASSRAQVKLYCDSFFIPVSVLNYPRLVNFEWDHLSYYEFLSIMLLYQIPTPFQIGSLFFTLFNKFDVRIKGLETCDHYYFERSKAFT